MRKLAVIVLVISLMSCGDDKHNSGNPVAGMQSVYAPLDIYYQDLCDDQRLSYPVYFRVFNMNTGELAYPPGLYYGVIMDGFKSGHITVMVNEDYLYCYGAVREMGRAEWGLGINGNLECISCCATSGGALFIEPDCTGSTEAVLD